MIQKESLGFQEALETQKSLGPQEVLEAQEGLNHQAQEALEAQEVLGVQILGVLVTLEAQVKVTQES